MKGLSALGEKGLAVGDFGFSYGQTIMITLLPVILSRHTESSLVIGAVMSIAGLAAIVMPFLIGTWSDHASTRSPFLKATAPLMAAALIATPFLQSMRGLVLSAFLFFCLLQSFRTPYLALISGKVDAERWGEVQGLRGSMHAGALGAALATGGVLFSIWEPLPFLVSAVIVLVTTWITLIASSHIPSSSTGPEEAQTKFIPKKLRRKEALWFLTSNIFWTGAIDGIRPYIFLFATVVIGISTAETSALLLPLLLMAGIGSFVLGKISDRYGRERTLFWSSLWTSLILMAGILIRDPWTAGIGLALAGFGAAGLLALPYPMFMDIVGEKSAGKSTGTFVMANGVAHLIAPVVVGGAIEFGRRFFPDERGYPIMWPTAGLIALIGVGTFSLSLRALRKRERSP